MKEKTGPRKLNFCIFFSSNTLIFEHFSHFFIQKSFSLIKSLILVFRLNDYQQIDFLESLDPKKMDGFQKTRLEQLYRDRPERKKQKEFEQNRVVVLADAKPADAQDGIAIERLKKVDAAFVAWRTQYEAAHPDAPKLDFIKLGNAKNSLTKHEAMQLENNLAFADTPERDRHKFDIDPQAKFRAAERAMSNPEMKDKVHSFF